MSGKNVAKAKVLEEDHGLINERASKRLPKPFIKWAGGKRQLLQELVRRVPRDFKRYHEPFVGGGALFFELCPKSAYLIDSNAELINAYQVVKSKVLALIQDLKRHRYETHYYYSVRALDRLDSFSDCDDISRASRFVYLNKTCFNGLYRVNSKGHFNVPFGRYANPKILDKENLLACSAALKDVEISHGSFLLVENVVRTGDFIYFDPPYVPLGPTSNFTGYTEGGFGKQDQVILAELCHRLDKRNIKFMLSNSCSDLVLDLYGSFNISIVKASRAINSDAKKRGDVEEVIVTNYS